MSVTVTEMLPDDTMPVRAIFGIEVSLDLLCHFIFRSALLNCLRGLQALTRIHDTWTRLNLHTASDFISLVESMSVSIKSVILLLSKKICAIVMINARHDLHQVRADLITRLNEMHTVARSGANHASRVYASPSAGPKHVLPHPPRESPSKVTRHMHIWTESSTKESKECQTDWSLAPSSSNPTTPMCPFTVELRFTPTCVAETTQQPHPRAALKGYISHVRDGIRTLRENSPSRRNPPPPVAHVDDALGLSALFAEYRQRFH